MLEGQAPGVKAWLETAGRRYGVKLVLLPQADWNNDLTPWSAEPVFKKGKAFGGNAEAYLQRLESEILPGIEAELGIVPDERWILGVSLAGLFAVWAAAANTGRNTRRESGRESGREASRSGLFARIAAISGSFWYPGFPQWLREQPLAPGLKAVYLSLGRKEAEGKNPHLKDIAAQTREVADILTGKGIPTTFAWTEGTHFAPVVPRLEQALNHLTQ